MSGSSNGFQSYPKLRVRSGSSDCFEPYPENNGGSESSRLSESHAEIIDASVSSKHSNSQPDEHIYDDELHCPCVKCNSCSSSSSIFSPYNASLSDDISQVNAKDGISTCTTSSHKTQEDVRPAPKDLIDGVSGNSSTSSNNLLNLEVREAVSPDPSPVHRISDVTHDSSTYNMSPTQSPPVQVMERLEGYDPCRIPSSVFERSGANTPLEWSVASNESLFSLHIGNSSFSKDHFVMHDLYKSGELTKSGELLAFSPRPPFASLDNRPPVPVVEIDKPSIEAGNAVTTGGVVNDETIENTTKDKKIENTTKAATKYEEEGKKSVVAVSRKSSKYLKNSEGSGDSTCSFAFPVLADEGKAEAEDNDLQPKDKWSKNSGFCHWLHCSSCWLWNCSLHCCRFRRCC